MATVIAAVDRKNGIGKDNGIPFYSDMGFFKSTTIGNLVIMGRRTWESLKEKPLSDRINVVVSTTLPDGRRFLRKWDQSIWVFHSLAQALDFAKEKHPECEAFIIGGEVLYKAAFDQNLVSRVLLSKIGCEADCDTHFPLTLQQLEERFGKHKTLGIDNDVAEPVLRLEYKRKVQS
jgi:dihydrofolate reductase